MRTLEVLCLGVTLVSFIALALPHRVSARWPVYLAGSGVLLALVQMLVEGYRWQMVPAYALAGLALILAWIQTRQQPKTRKGWRLALAWIGKGFGFLLLLGAWGLALALPLLVPVFNLPAPTGPYTVGRTARHLIDQQRPEIYTTDDPQDVRELMVTVWYPAEETPGARPMPYWEDPRFYGAPFTSRLKLPGFLFDHLKLAKTHTYADLPVATGGPFPVLIFSHGLSVGFATQNSFMLEELASQGYVIFSIDHPYEGLVVGYPDGRQVFEDGELTKRMSDEISAANEVYILSESSPSERQTALEAILSPGTGFDASIHVWVEDTRFVLDQIETFNNLPDDRFAGKLDLSRVGLFGHSYGGATATLFCVLDARCSAALNMDGFSFGHELLSQGLSAPYLMFYADDPLIANRQFNRFVFDAAQGPAYAFRLLGSKHSDFTDLTLFSPVFKSVGFLGPNSGLKMAQSVNQVVLAFFDRHIKGEAGSVLDDPGAQIPLVELIEAKK